MGERAAFQSRPGDGLTYAHKIKALNCWVITSLPIPVQAKHKISGRKEWKRSLSQGTKKAYVHLSAPHHTIIKHAASYSVACPWPYRPALLRSGKVISSPFGLDLFGISIGRWRFTRTSGKAAVQLIHWGDQRRQPPRKNSFSTKWILFSEKNMPGWYIPTQETRNMASKLKRKTHTMNF